MEFQLKKAFILFSTFLSSKQENNKIKSNNPFIESFTRLGYLALSLIFFYSAIMAIFINYLNSLSMAVIGMAVLFFAGIFFFLISKKAELIKNYLIKFLGYLSLRRIFIFALLLRLLWVALSGTKPVSDCLQYDLKAIEFLNGKIAMNGIWPTGPSIFIFLHYLLLGYNIIYPQISITILSAIQVILVYKILIHVTNDKNTALFGGLILALWPESILYSNLLASDTLFSVNVLITIWLLSLAFQSTNRMHSYLYFLAGISLGIAHWMRPTAILLILSSLLFIGFNPNKMLKLRIKNMSFLIIAVIILLIPIVLLNYSTFDIISIRSLSSTQSLGWNMVVGTNLESHGRWHKEIRGKIFEEMKKYEPKKDEHPILFRDRVAKNIALKRVCERPFDLLFMAIKYKIKSLWGDVATLHLSLSTSRFKNFAGKICLLSDIWHKIILLVCAITIILGVNRKIFQLNILQIYLYFALLTTTLHFFLESQPRYHHVFLPYISICVSYLILLGKGRQNNSKYGVKNG